MQSETNTQKIPWLFDAATDLGMFVGSASIALGLLALGAQYQWLSGATPDWLWIVAILLIDVAHVYATGFRVYFDRTELRKRPWLYGLTPLLALIIGMAVHSENSQTFWRLLAYLAVFHFVRQQYGWVALYRARAGEKDRTGWWVDSVAVYLATVYPLAHWHAALPREFHWFQDGDFVRLPQLLSDILQPLYWMALVTYFVRAVYRAVVQRKFNPGKDLVVLTTAVCWYIGIVAMNSDYAFTVTNVIIHGVPYLVLVYRIQRATLESRAEDSDVESGRSGPRRRFGFVGFLGLCWLLAYIEEMLWDNGVWQERSWLFGSFSGLASFEWLLVPLLAVPQITHYVLDGFIWKRRQHHDLENVVRPGP